MKRCKELGLKPHPARFPKDFADFFIKFATNEGDLVIDPFAGSNTTGYAENNFDLGVSPSYARGRAFRSNLFVRSSQKGFPLQSLTQSYCIAA
jgi:DNA methylase